MTNSAPAFPIRRPRIRKKPSPTPSPIWPRAGRWTGWSAAMSASARPKWRCAPPLSPPWRASRWRWWCRPRLLARQHYRGFAERFAGFPLKVRQLSRFVDAKEARETKEALADGTVDIVVGTHALLAESIDFKRLGLVDRGRGAAFRRRAQGTAEEPQGRCPCPDPDGDADPAHLATGAVGRARSVADHHAADRPAGGAHLRHALRSAGGARGAAARTLSRRPELLRRAAHRRSARGRSIPEGDGAGSEDRGGAWPDVAARCWKR